MCTPVPDHQVSEAIRWIASLAVPAIAGLGGVAVGAWLTSKRELAQRKLAFLESQLTNFYSPMLGLRNEVRSEGAFRARVHQAASAAWEKLCAGLDVAERQRLMAERGPEFTRLAIEYDNTTLRERLLPAYERMVQLFRENFYLAEPETQGHYQAIVEFVEGWKRWVEKTLPPEVLNELEHREHNLESFYAQIEAKHAELRARLQQGKA